MGGMGLPNLQVYHQAVTLDQVKYWWRNSPDKSWPSMEAEILGVSDWKEALLDPIGTLESQPHMSPPVRTTLHYWRELLRGDICSWVLLYLNTSWFCLSPHQWPTNRFLGAGGGSLC